MSVRVGAARYFGQGAAIPSGTTLQELTSHFLFSDDFTRANNPVVGNGWVEELETSEILANHLRQSGGGGGSVFAHRPNAEATAANVWAQSIGQWSTDTVPIVLGLFNTDPFAGRDGYQVRKDGFAATLRLERQTGGAIVLLASTGVASAINTDYVNQLAVSSAPLQEFNWWKRGTPASIRSLTAADALHAGLAKRASHQRGGAVGAETGDWDSCLICRGAVDPMHITCTTMRVGSGDKIRVFDAVAALVAEATEVAGVATIELYGLASGLEWPLVGHPTISLTDAANVPLSTLTGAGLIDGGVFPGGTFQAV